MKNLQIKKQRNSIKVGDVFELGRHRLLCGNAGNPDHLKLLIQNDVIKAIITDPPYGVAYVESKEGFYESKSAHVKIANDHLQSETEYRNFSKKWLQSVKPYLNSKNSLYIFNSDRMLFALRDGMKEAGYFFSQLLIWIKNQAVIGRMDYLPQHELVAYGWFGKHEFIRSKDKSILFCPKPQKSKVHPTMKPVSLLRNLILNSSRIGDVVYDPFGGSGSTLIAAEQTSRKCLMVEIEPHYCQVILDRFEKLTGQKPVKISSLSSKP